MSIVKDVGHVYVYTKYCTRFPLVEKEVEVFSDKDDARTRLRERLEAACGCSWDQIPEELAEMVDAFTLDKVEICNNEGHMEVYTVDEQPIR